MAEFDDNIEVQELFSIMANKSGRNVIFRILSQTNVYDNVFDADARIHAKNEGRREIGVWLINELKAAAPGEYLQMLKENTDG